ncbi:unnamed protein product [Adineta steineri]|uniref:Uncharacterized protein n=1 Tax=Adineta steineri TaxID=433720 RepID=A0A815WRS2_9BILA|nr:unnamed protein product [Adineta steineri]CAF1546689.1 unnamed protein product [Adineta steineri]
MLLRSKKITQTCETTTIKQSVQKRLIRKLVTRGQYEFEIEVEEEILVQEEEQIDQLQKVEEDREEAEEVKEEDVEEKKEVEEEEEEEEADEEEEEEEEKIQIEEDNEEEEKKQVEEEKKHYNLRKKREPHVQVQAPVPKPRSCRAINKATEADSNSLVKYETEENQASSSTRTLRPRLQLAAPAVKPRKIYTTTTSTEMCTIQYTKLKEQIEERINTHIQREKAAGYLYNSKKQLDINELLTSLDELSAHPKLKNLSKTFIEHQSTQPRFLTDLDFQDGTLECKEVNNKPAVYAVTICVPDWLYASMKSDPELRDSEVLGTAWFDGMGSVHLRGKIGEAKNFHRRVRTYNSNDKTSGLGPLFDHLRKEAKESKAEFTDWVKVRAILSGERLRDEEERIKMETRCSFLLGEDGNSGYNCVGQFHKFTHEETVARGKILQKRLDKIVKVENGLQITLRMLNAAKAHETRSKPIPGPNGTITNSYKLAGAKYKATMSATFIDPVRGEISGYDIIRSKCLEGSKKVKPQKDGRLRNGYQQKAATRYQNDSAEAIKEIDDFVERMNLKKEPGYVKPKTRDTTLSKTSQYGWRAKCPECKEVYCVTNRLRYDTFYSNVYKRIAALSSIVNPSGACSGVLSNTNLIYNDKSSMIFSNGAHAL